MNVLIWNARARNGHVEATLNHPFPAQVELQSKAAMRVAAARQAIIQDFDVAYDIATQDVSQQLPPLDLSVSVS